MLTELIVAGVALSLMLALFIAIKVARRPKPNYIVVDGSNVMHWEDETPNLQSVVHVLRALESEGFTPVVWFDANAGYLTVGRYMGPGRLARLLDLYERQVQVAAKGTPADPLFLEAAVKLGARVVTNDRFRDWVEEFPQIREDGFLVRGRMSRDSFELELGLGAERGRMGEGAV